MVTLLKIAYIQILKLFKENYIFYSCALCTKKLSIDTKYYTNPCPNTLNVLVSCGKKDVVKRTTMLMFKELSLFILNVMHKGDTHLRTAYRPFLALRIAYRHFLASRTAYRLTTKTTIFGVSIYINKIK